MTRDQLRAAPWWLQFTAGAVTTFTLIQLFGTAGMLTAAVACVAADWWMAS